jgi:hypothetical protein
MEQMLITYLVPCKYKGTSKPNKPMHANSSIWSLDPYTFNYLYVLHLIDSVAPLEKHQMQR